MLNTSEYCGLDWKKLMKGDIIIVEAHHYQVAEQIVNSLIASIKQIGRGYSISVAGESGSGKSETAKAIAEILEANDVGTVILQQDDYFIYPPKSNDAKRRQDISWVGPKEVKIDLLNSNITAFCKGAASIDKPLINYTLNNVKTECIDVSDSKVVIVEGTYTTLLNDVDTRIFIARNFNETREHRQKRNRAASELDHFTEQVLKIEHKIISTHCAHADIIINSDYSIFQDAQD
jgi:uridine kinase